MRTSSVSPSAAPASAPKAARPALLPERERQQGEEHQELRHRLGDRVPREPDLDHVDGQEQRRQQRHRRPEHAAPGEEHGQRAQHAEDAGGGQGAPHAHGLEQIGAEGGEQVEELGHDAPVSRALEGHAHEAAPGESALSGCGRRAPTSSRGIERTTGSTYAIAARARDEGHGRDVDAGIAAAHHVFAGPRLEGERDGEHGEGGRERARPGPGRAGRSAAFRGGRATSASHRRERARHQRRPREREAADLRRARAPPRTKAATLTADDRGTAPRRSGGSRGPRGGARPGRRGRERGRARARRDGRAGGNERTHGRAEASRAQRSPGATSRIARTTASAWRVGHLGEEGEREDLARGALRHREVAGPSAELREGGLQVQRDRVVDRGCRSRAPSGRRPGRRGADGGPRRGGRPRVRTAARRAAPRRRRPAPRW